MPTLIEISQDLLAFKSLLDECDTEITPEIEQSMESWFAELDATSKDKLDNYAALIRDVQLRASARKEEMERLHKRIKVDENTARRLKDRLKMFFEVQGIKSIDTRRYKLTLCKNAGKTPIEITGEPEDLPMQYQRLEVKADTDLIRKALECNQVVPGAKLLPRGTNLRIS